MRCYQHSDVDAVASCAQCGKAVCQHCAVEVAGRIHCKDCLSAGATVGSRTEQTISPPPNRMALISAVCGLGGWLLYVLICCFNSTLGALLSLATLGLAYVCLVAIGLIPLLAWIAGVIAGHMGIREISESGGAERGREMALAGMISGYVGLGLTLCGCIAALVLTAAGVSVPFIEGLLHSLGG